MVIVNRFTTEDGSSGKGEVKLCNKFYNKKIPSVLNYNRNQNKVI